MPLKNFMTQTASTTRHPAISSGKVGDPVTNLTNLKITPLAVPDNQTYQRIVGERAFDGTEKQLHLTFTESHAHTDSSVAVTQLPDIVQGDYLVVGSTTYTIDHVYIEPATTSFGRTLLLLVSEDKTR